MSIVLYNIFLSLYQLGVHILSLWNPKAKKWLLGRKNIFEKMGEAIPPGNEKRIWVHCSSLGEFEQGRPLIDKLKLEYPGFKIFLTFFSPSGYEIRKDYQQADWVFYLPMDSKQNAKKFFDIVNPSLVIFVKYDYWYYYFSECKTRKIPLLMISTIFRKSQPFFKWYGKLNRKILQCVTHFFVQDKNSISLLNNIQIKNITLAGDTRFDRALEIAGNFSPIPEIDRFCKHSTVFVAGSTWPVDEKLLKESLDTLTNIKLIIAPHETNVKHLLYIKSLFPDALFFSEINVDAPSFTNANVLIIDNIGMLSRLYKYSSVSYVGGGFNSGIHNILEPAAFNKPVIIGPRYQKFREAVELVKRESAFVINNSKELKEVLDRLINNENDIYSKTQSANMEFMMTNKGATEKILTHLQEYLLLTSK